MIMERVIKIGRYLFFIVLLICAVFSIVFFLHKNQVVATADENKICYNNETYIECFELYDFEKDKYIGRVDFPIYNSSLKMYSIREMPDYILIDMGMDYRIYKKES